MVGRCSILVIKLRRVEIEVVFILDVVRRYTLLELEEESPVLLSSSNLDLLGLILMKPLWDN